MIDHSLQPTGPAISIPKRVLNLAWPVIAENFLETLLGIVDTALVAHLGAAATAGVGSAQQMMQFLISALSALSIGSAVLVAQNVGAKNLKRAGTLARQSLMWSVVLSIPLAIVGYFTAPAVIGVFGLQPNVAAIGVDYLKVTMGTVVVLVLLFIGSGVSRGAGDSRTPMIATAIANVINIPLAYGLINGVAGLPHLGPVGSAWATLFARCVALVILMAALWRGRNGVTISGDKGVRLDTAVFKQVLGIGLPAALEQILTAFAFLALSIVMAGLGTVMLAAHRITISALSLSFLPGFGFAIAATSLVGQSVGAKRPDEARQITKVAALWAMLWMGGIGILGFIFAPQVIRLFSEDPAVIDAGASALRIVVLSQPLLGLSFVQGGALRGTGDTRIPLVLSAGTWWLSVILAWLALRLFGSTLQVAWAGFSIATPIGAALMWWAFNRRMRKLPTVAV